MAASGVDDETVRTAATMLGLWISITLNVFLFCGCKYCYNNHGRALALRNENLEKILTTLAINT